MFRLVGQNRRLRRRGVAMLAVALAVVATTASAASAARTTTTINVGIVSGDVSYAAPFVGQKLNYFAKQKVAVKVQLLTPADATAALVSGRIDILMSGISTAFVLAVQKQAVSVVGVNSGGAVASYLLAKNSITNPKDCGTVATATPGTQVYAWAQYLKNLIGASWNIIPINNANILGSAVASGQYDCALGTFTAFSGIVAAGQAHLLIDPSVKGGVPAGYPSTVIAGVLIGLKKNLQSKRAAVAGFVRGLVQANQYIKTHSAQTTGDMIKTVDVFTTFSQSPAFIASIQHTQPFLTPCNGFLPSSSWALNQVFTAESGLGAASNNATRIGYKSIVDMSYYNSNKANVPSCVKKKKK